MPFPRRMNRLAREKSPYLQQHADNPVDWHPWGEEAFTRARAGKKPVFLSIGYSSCHWCHVMEEQSFQDEEVGRALNADFVSIKVDREERPDVDELYMDAVVYGMGIQGGWPLSVWLTPDGRPFYGGTYFPKDAFLQVLRRVAEVWKDPTHRAELEGGGEKLAEHLRRIYGAARPQAAGREALAAARQAAERNFDAQYGGFGSPPLHQPKFPSPSSLEMLLRHALAHGDEGATAMVRMTLTAMREGGIHDHIGGGFHRYSVTRDWLVPHFEKMLYDNAQLLGLYAWAHLATDDENYARTARRIVRWVSREMTHPDGGFYSAQDADDPGGYEGEGGFYTWSPEEVETAVGAERAKKVRRCFSLTPWREKPGRCILEALESAPDDLLEAMYDARERRPKPMTDTKVLAAWNGLMISGLARAYTALGDEECLRLARRAARFVQANMTRDATVFRRWRDGEAAHDGVLSDYANLAAAYLDLYECDFDPDWLRAALALCDAAVERFHDARNGGFFSTAEGGAELIARAKSGTDQAMPSGNGVMAMNLLRIAELTGDERRRKLARETIDAFGAFLGESGLAFGALLNALHFAESGPREIFIAGDRDAARPLIEAVWRNPDPNRVLALATPGIETLLPPAAGKTPVDGKPAAYVCRNFTCRAPVTDPSALASARP